MGYWGEAGQAVTWKNPQFVSEEKRQSGGWYYNPATNRVDRWWTGSPPQQTTTSGGGGGGGGTDWQAISNRLAEEQRAREEAERRRLDEARAREQQFYSQARTEEQGLLGRYTTAIQGLEPLTAIRQRLATDLNLPSLEQAANFLTSTLENIPQNVSTLAKQVGISAPRMEQRMQALASTISPAQQQAERQAQAAQANLTNLLQYETAQQERSLLPFAQEFTLLKDRIARETTGFTAEVKGQLDLLLQELENTGSLTDQQLQTARELALKEEEYQLEKMKLENARSVQTVDGRVKLINSYTGETIADLGSSRSGAGTTTADIGSAIDAYEAEQAAKNAQERQLTTTGTTSTYTPRPWIDYTPMSSNNQVPASVMPTPVAPSLSQQVSNLNITPLPGTSGYISPEQYRKSLLSTTGYLNF